MIELKLWQFLCAFEKHKTLKNTAEAQHITQPALSQAFRRLEQDLGVSLFVRSSHYRITLNEAGKTACRLAAALLEQAQSLEQTLQHQVLHIGLGTPVLVACVRKCAAQLGMEEQTSVACFDDSDWLQRQFEEGQLDLIVTQKTLTDPVLACRSWIREQLYLAVHDHHPLAYRESLRGRILPVKTCCCLAISASGRKWCRRI